MVCGCVAWNSWRVCVCVCVCVRVCVCVCVCVCMCVHAYVLALSLHSTLNDGLRAPFCCLTWNPMFSGIGHVPTVVFIRGLFRVFCTNCLQVIMHSSNCLWVVVYTNFASDYAQLKLLVSEYMQTVCKWLCTAQTQVLSHSFKMVGTQVTLTVLSFACVLCTLNSSLRRCALFPLTCQYHLYWVTIVRS